MVKLKILKLVGEILDEVSEWSGWFTFWEIFLALLVVGVAVAILAPLVLVQ